MKAPMSISVRLKLSDLIAPEEGNSARLLMYRKFRGGLSLSPEEQELVGYSSKDGGNGMIANYLKFPDKDPMKEIDVGEIITEVVCKKLKELDDAGKLNDSMLDLFLWFKENIDKQYAEGK